jgi:soluble lytic murein transglycosylase-like protein
MAVEKSLTVRDYLEPRYAAAASSRLAGAARKSLASFQDMLKTRAPKPDESAAAGLRISEYLKNPVLKTQTTRPPSVPAVSNSTALNPRSTETPEEAGTSQRTRKMESERAAQVQGDRSARRLSRTTLQEFRAGNASSHPVEKSIQQAAAKYNLSPELIRSVIRAESNFQAEAVSPAGAKGLMQLMPETAKELGVTNPFDIQQNIDGGARYLRQMLDRFGGDLKRALAAYNAGPGAVEQYNGEVPFSETRQYVQRVLRYAGLRA